MAALLSNEIDWAEAPATDSLAVLKSRGFVISENPIPHVWPWQFSLAEGAPTADVRVRQAANLCIDRDALREALSGQMRPAVGMVPPGHPWYGNPKFDIKYDPAAAQALMKEAGFSAQKPVVWAWILRTMPRR